MTFLDQNNLSFSSTSLKDYLYSHFYEDPNQICSWLSESILITINPLYNKIEDYNTKPLYTLARKTYYSYDHITKFEQQDIEANYRPQTVIISGGTGSGKTTLFHHLLHLYQKLNKMSNDDESDILTKASYILDFFGNCYTPENSNSSKYMNHIDIYIDHENNQINKVKLKPCFFNNAKLDSIFNQQQSFHCFYVILMSIISMEYQDIIPENSLLYKEASNLKDILPNFDNAQIPQYLQYENINKLLNDLQFTNQHKYYIISTIICILHLLKSITNFFDETHFKYAMDILNLDFSVTKEVMTVHTVRDVAYPLEDKKVIENISALCEFLYLQLFKFILNRVNITINQIFQNKHSKHPHSKKIRVFDLLAFQTDKSNNCFERFINNYINEVFFQTFIDHIYQKECQIYTNQYVKFNLPPALKNGSKLINSYNKNIFIDLFNVSKDLSKLQNFKLADNFFYNNFKKKLSAAGSNQVCSINFEFFKINHYFGEIKYNYSDFVQQGLQRKFQKFEGWINSKVQWFDEIQEDFSSIHDLPVILNKLLQDVDQSTVYFVTCIKCNDKKKPLFFEEDYIEDQLKYLIDYAIPILYTLNYPCRLPFITFHDILKNQNAINLPVTVNDTYINILLNNIKINVSDYSLGISYLFLKEGILNIIIQELKKWDLIKYSCVLKQYYKARLRMFTKIIHMCTYLTSKTYIRKNAVEVISNHWNCYKLKQITPVKNTVINLQQKYLEKNIPNKDFNNKTFTENKENTELGVLKKATDNKIDHLDNMETTIIEKECSDPKNLSTLNKGTQNGHRRGIIKKELNTTKNTKQKPYIQKTSNTTLEENNDSFGKIVNYSKEQKPLKSNNDNLFPNQLIVKNEPLNVSNLLTDDPSKTKDINSAHPTVGDMLKSKKIQLKKLGKKMVKLQYKIDQLNSFLKTKNQDGFSNHPDNVLVVTQVDSSNRLANSSLNNPENTYLLYKSKNAKSRRKNAIKKVYSEQNSQLQATSVKRLFNINPYTHYSPKYIEFSTAIETHGIQDYTSTLQNRVKKDTDRQYCAYPNLIYKKAYQHT